MSLLNIPSKILTRILITEYRIEWNNNSEKNKLDSTNIEVALI